MAEMLRASPSEMVGRSSLDFVPAESRAAAGVRHQRRQVGEAEQFDLRLLRQDGSTLETAISVSPMSDAAGRFQGTVALVTDGTEKRQLEEQFRQSHKMEAIGTLAGGIAHDFNNMLSVILSFATMGRDDLPPNHPVRDDLAEVIKAGERAGDLTRQILAFSRKQVLQPAVLSANTVLSSLEPMLWRLLGEDLLLTFSLDPTLGRIKADPGQLEQVVMNLAVNARDAMPGGGRLTIETANVDLDQNYRQSHLDSRIGPHVMIAVTDTGQGIDKATQARVFEPFFTTKELGQGTGLGLATVFGIVKQSGGSIWLYSEVGRGTTFKLYFPRTDEVPVAPVVAAPAPKLEGQVETLLVVEDEPLLRAVMQTILQRAGYRVLVAESPVAAVEASRLHPGPIELLLTDVVMPKLTGKQLAQQLTAERPQTKVLYMSGYTDNTIVHHGVLDEGVAFLAKPITPEALLAKVRSVLVS